MHRTRTVWSPPGGDPLWSRSAQVESPLGVASGIGRATRLRGNVGVRLIDTYFYIRGIADGAKPPLLAIGEAKWNDTTGIAHIERLQHIRDLITRAGRYDTTHTQLLCSSGAGFNDKACTAAATSPGIRLLDLATSYDET